MKTRVVIAMGSNLGDRLDYLQGGLDGLFDTPRLAFLAVSPVYETTREIDNARNARLVRSK